MKIKNDCFAYNEEKRTCTALTELFCCKEECKFYKTHQQIADDYRLASERKAKAWNQKNS